jgi:hypothetical protein
MSFDVNSFVAERVVRGVGLNASNEVLWMVNQVENASIKCDGEEVLKKDAQGSTIASISKAKTCTVDFESSVFDLNLVAAQNGTTKKVATSIDKITAPIFETITITSSNLTAVVLSNSVKNSGTQGSPVYKIAVSTLTTDGSLKKKFTIGATASTGVCTYTSNSKTLGFVADDLVAGDTLFVEYEYETENAVQVVNSAEDFPTASKAIFLVKGFDVCNQSTAIYAYVTLPNAKMSTSSTISFNLEDTIPVSLSCAYDYCSTDKELYRIIIAQ